MKYLDPKKTFIISCTNKQLQIPGFRKKYVKATVEEGKLTGNWLVSNNYETITKIMTAISKTRTDINVIVIDDANYCLSNNIMQDALIKGWNYFMP